MKLYYQNETLFIDIETLVDDEKITYLKRRIFHIIDDYEIDKIVMNVPKNDFVHQKSFRKFYSEYQQKYDGTLLIKWM